jgi:NADPH:quinone reductase
MRAVVATRHGGPEVLEVQEREVADPGPGQLLVDVAAAGVNFVDTYHRSGLYPGETPHVVGREGAGRVVEVGEGVTEFSPGDRVGWVSVPGSSAERALVDAARAVPIPDGVSDEQAAAVLLQGLTAHYLSHSTYPVEQGETVLVHAAAGGVGLLLTQMIKRRGGRVIGTVSTAEKERLAREAGADEVIRYTEVDFALEVRRLTGGEGVPAVFDGVGKATFDGSMHSLRPRGKLILFGYASGQVPPVDPHRLYAGSLWLTRPQMAAYTATREELLERARDVLGWVAEGTLQVRIGGRYRMDDARAAHEDLEGRRSTGKLVIIVR